MSKKMNIFLPPVINTDDDGKEFVDTNYFVIELEYPYGVDWYAEDEDFMPYINKHKKEIFAKTPTFYRGEIYAVSLRDTEKHLWRSFYAILKKEENEQ